MVGGAHFIYSPGFLILIFHSDIFLYNNHNHFRSIYDCVYILQRAQSDRDGHLHTIH